MAVSNKVVIEGFEGAEVRLSSEGNTVKLDPEVNNQVTLRTRFVIVRGGEGAIRGSGYATDTNAVATATVAAESGC